MWVGTELVPSRQPLYRLSPSDCASHKHVTATEVGSPSLPEVEKEEGIYRDSEGGTGEALTPSVTEVPGCNKTLGYRFFASLGPKAQQLDLESPTRNGGKMSLCMSNCDSYAH